jgi:excisionase family DNA binding protein
MAEAARIKGVSYHTVSRAVRNGRLPVFRLGRMGLISGDDLENWQPMRERAPRRYRQPDETIETVIPVTLDEALGERLEIARQLATLFEVIHAASSELPLVEFGELLANRFSTIFGLSRVALWIWNPRDGTGERIANVGEYLSPTPARIDVSGGYQKFLDFTQQGSAHVSLDPRTEFADSLPTAVPIPSNPMLIVPLRVRDRSIGAILGDREGEPVSIDQAQLSLAQVLGNQAALAVDHAMLRIEERFRITQLSTILDQLNEHVRACDTQGRINLINRADVEFNGGESSPGSSLGSNAMANPEVIARHELDGTPITIDRHPLARALAGESVTGWEYEITRSDGRIQRARVNARPLIIDGDITGAVYIGRNVTAEHVKEQGEQLRVAQLERAGTRARAIADLAMQLNAASSYPVATQIALDCLTSEFEGSRGLVFMMQDDGGLILSGKSRVPESLHLPVVHNPISISTTILAFSRNTPVAVAREEAGRLEQSTMTLLDATGLLVVPLQVNTDPFGAFHLFHDAAVLLEDDDLTFAATIGRHCAQALDRLHLLEDLRQTRAQLAATAT